jgi:hypothetical protein
LDEEIFSMDDDELPPKLTPKPPTEDELNGVASSEEDLEEDMCFGFPCSNNIYHGSCKKCETDSICALVTASVQQGFEDMKGDVQGLWEKDVVKVWTAFLTVCYFNIPCEAMFAGAMYLVHVKCEKHINLEAEKMQMQLAPEEKEVEMTEQKKDKIVPANIDL